MAIEKLMCFLIALPSKVEKVITQNVHSLMEIKCLLSLQGFLGNVVAALSQHQIIICLLPSGRNFVISILNATALRIPIPNSLLYYDPQLLYLFFKATGYG